MDYNVNIKIIKELVQDKKYTEAENMLLSTIQEAKVKNVEDENNTHYCFNSYIESLMFWNMYKPQKKNLNPDINYAEVYYYLGFINIEQKNYDKALEYLKEGLKWNPVDTILMFEEAATYRMLGNIELAKAKVEKAHFYIYNSPYLAKYFRQLGWFYTERRVFDIANALYTFSLSFHNTELARSELMYIAKQENREVKYSSKEEIETLFRAYNIPLGYSKKTVDMIIEEYERTCKDKPPVTAAKYLAPVLYDITHEEKYKQLMERMDSYSKVVNENLAKSESTSQKSVVKDNSELEDLILKYNRYEIETDEFLDSVNKIKDKINIIRVFKVIGKIENGIPTEGTSLQELLWQTDKGLNRICFTSFQKSHENKPNFETMAIPDKFMNIVKDCVNANQKLVINRSGNDDSVGIPPETLIRFIIQDKVANEDINTKNENDKLKMYSQEIENFPTFKFYFPEDLGEYEKIDSRIFEIKKDNKQMIRVTMWKCDTIEQHEEKAKKWIEKNINTNNMEQVEYRKEKINNIPLEVYVMKYIDRPKAANRIYKIGYINNCIVTISGPNINGKEEIINQAFEKLEWNERESKPKSEYKYSFEKLEKDLKIAFQNYESGKVKETLKSLDGTINTLLINDKTLGQDIFWKVLTSSVFKAIVLNNFYNKRELTPNNLDSLLANETEVKKNILEFCNNFRNDENINFINQIEDISDKMLKDVIHILMVNIGKMNIKISTTKITNKEDGEKNIAKPLTIECPICNNSFDLMWQIPDTQKTFYCTCPNCKAELKRGNPNYKEN